MKRIGVFVDVSNIYYCVGKKFERRKLDYNKYLDFIKELGEIVKAIAYGSQLRDEAVDFIYCLKKTGFQPKFKTIQTRTNDSSKRQADWDVGIAMDIVSMIGRLDMIILGTADGNLEPVVDWAIRQGVDVVIFACGINKVLKTRATEFIEIPESLLEEIDEAS